MMEEMAGVDTKSCRGDREQMGRLAGREGKGRDERIPKRLRGLGSDSRLVSQLFTLPVDGPSSTSEPQLKINKTLQLDLAG